MAAKAAARKTRVAKPRGGRKQTVGFGLVSVAVRLKPLIEPRKPVSANIVTADDHEQIKMAKIRPSTGEIVEETVKGYKQPDGSFVVLEDGAVDALVAEKTGQLELERVVEVGAIDPLYFSTAYLLFAEEGAERPFALLAGVLRESGMAAVGTAVLGKQTQMVVLRHSEATGCLLAHVCYFDSEVRWADVELVAGAAEAASERELALASQLLSTLEGEFDPGEVEDSYYPALQELIAATAAGQPFVAPAVEAEVEPVIDMMAALEASVAAAEAKPKRKKVAA